MSRTISAPAPPLASLYSRTLSKSLTSRNCCSNLSLSSSLPALIQCPSTSLLPRTISLRCNSSTGPPGPGENENRTILDAFFLGKALAEALNERIESTVGEFLSTIGRLQAEQQKQVVDFQEEVLERAKKAKEKAARKAMEVKSSPSFSTTKISKVTNNSGTSSIVSSSAADDVSLISPSSPASGFVNGDNDQNPTNTDPF